MAAEHSWSRLQQEGSNETGLVSTVRRQNQHSLAPCLPTPIRACRLSFLSLGLMALSWQVGCVWGFPAVAEQRKMWVQFIMEMNWKSLMETDWIYRMFSAVLQGASAEARRGSVWQPGVCIGQRLGSSSSCCAQGSWSSGQQRGGPALLWGRHGVQQQGCGALGFLWKLLCKTETRGLACAIGLRASWPAQLGQLLLVFFLLVKEISCVDMGSPVLRALVQVSRCGATGAASRTPEGWFHFKLCHCDFLPMH